jgi:hypothetical protein
MKVLDQAVGKDWILYRGDSCKVIGGIPDRSVGLCLHSPPFSNLYIYSDSVADMGNSSGHEEFFSHYRYLVAEILRVMIPGRLCVVHCKDLPLYKGRDGSMGLYDFPGAIVRLYTELGWTLHSKVTIWKDPVTEMQRTKNHGLLYKELCKDSCGSRQGMADYLMVFRSWEGEFTDPVTVGGERFDTYTGFDPPDASAIALDQGLPSPIPDKWGRWPRRNPFPEGSEAYRIWSIKVWQKYASPVWFDIDMMNVLNERAARDSKDCRHICPLQLDVIDRAVQLWSNPGDVVFSPFAGIGSEIHGAIKAKRRGMGIELKDSYYDQAVTYISELEREMSVPTLFPIHGEIPPADDAVPDGEDRSGGFFPPPEEDDEELLADKFRPIPGDEVDVKADEDEDWRAVGLDVLSTHGMTASDLRCLAKAGVATFGKLIDCMGGDDGLSAIPGIGAKSAQRISSAIDAWAESNPV